METVYLLPVMHNGAEQIFLRYPHVQKLNQEIRKIKGVKWSSTHKSWYITLSKESYERINDALQQIAVVDNTALKKFLEKKKQLGAIKQIENKIGGAIEIAPKFFKPQLKKLGGNQPDNDTIIVSKKTDPFFKQYKISESNLASLQKMTELLLLKAYSQRTIQTYRNEVMLFMQVLGKNNAANLSTDDVKRYILQCIKNGIGENTIHSRINALKFYYEQLLGKQKFFVEIPRPKKPLLLPKVLGETELRKLFAAATNLKHKAILFVAYSAGLRVSEVINLRLQDIDRERQQLFIHCSKGKKDRYVRLSPLVLDILEQYYRKCTVKPTNYLFEGLESGEPYSIRSAQQIFSDAKSKAGIRKTVSFHSLRHSFATHLLEKGIQVLYIRDILGHFDIKTTERYLHVKRETLINIESPIDALYTKK